MTSSELFDVQKQNSKKEQSMRQNYFKIDPMHERQAFLRKAWISLAQEDVPLDVFSSDFSDVEQEEYHLLCTGADYEMEWSGEIGDHRMESYIDIETYYENEPYTEYVREYDASTRSYHQKPVTKYRSVEKQRQVTRQRQVTDWHSGSGEHSGGAKSWECIDERGTFDHTRYNQDIDSRYFTAFTEEEMRESPDMIITDEMLTRANALCVRDAEINLHCAIPGDTSRNVTYCMYSYTPTYASLYRFPEYTASISYMGITYTKRAFAFGGMTMSKVDIPNPISVETEKRKLGQERDKKIAEEREEIEKKGWAKAFKVYLASIGAFVLSLVCSLFINYLLPVILLFVTSVGGYIFAKQYVKYIEKTASEELTAKTEEITAIYAERVENYKKERLATIISTLNKKLVSLGLEPVTAREFKGGEDDG